MYKTQDSLRDQFVERYQKLGVSALLINDSIALLRALDSNSDSGNLKDFISTVSTYDATSEDSVAVKQLLSEVLNHETEIKVALAHLNYLYDVACFKRSHLAFMKETFGYFF